MPTNQQMIPGWQQFLTGAQTPQQMNVYKMLLAQQLAKSVGRPTPKGEHPAETVVNALAPFFISRLATPYTSKQADLEQLKELLGIRKTLGEVEAQPLERNRIEAQIQYTNKKTGALQRRERLTTDAELAAQQNVAVDRLTEMKRQADVREKMGEKQFGLEERRTKAQEEGVDLRRGAQDITGQRLDIEKKRYDIAERMAKLKEDKYDLDLEDPMKDGAFRALLATVPGLPPEKRLEFIRKNVIPMYERITNQKLAPEDMNPFLKALNKVWSGTREFIGGMMGTEKPTRSLSAPKVPAGAGQTVEPTEDLDRLLQEYQP